MDVDLKSLDSVRTFCESVKASGIGLDCVVGNAAVYYPMLKDPEKFRLGFHMAGAGSLPANRMGSDARVTADGFEESVGVIHLAHFLMFQLLVDSVAEHGRRVNHAPRMIIVGSITHNPDELAGKIPPQANLGDCDGLLNGLKVADGNVMIDGKRSMAPRRTKTPRRRICSRFSRCTAGSMSRPGSSSTPCTRAASPIRRSSATTIRPSRNSSQPSRSPSKRPASVSRPCAPIR